MQSSQIVQIGPVVELIPDNASKDIRSRLMQFQQWQQSNGLTWIKPNLAAYRDYLLTNHKNRKGEIEPLSAASVNAHLSTIRGRYDTLLTSDEGRDYFYAHAPADGSLADRKAFVDEMVGRVYSALNPKLTSAETIIKQDHADSDQGIRLTRDQVRSLLNMPDIATKQGLRDLSLIALALCTGLREMELAALNVADLRQRLNGELAVAVYEGKGKKQRLVPYGQLVWCLAIVDTWLNAAGITEGAVFRSFYKGDAVSPRRLSLRGIENVVKHNRLMLDGQLTTLRPHDLRRTYARRLYDAGMGILEIQRNLGHSDHKTTERYIGVGDSSHRAPADVYGFNVNDFLSRWRGEA